MPTQTINLSWTRLKKCNLGGMLSKTNFNFSSNTKVTDLHSDDKRVAEQIRCLINKASGKNPEAYMHMLFPKSIESQLKEKTLKNILKLIEPLGNTGNRELLHLRQKILLEISNLGPSFIRKNSRISSSTIYEYQKKSKRETILSRSPKKCGAPTTPQKVIEKFVKFLK